MKKIFPEYKDLYKEFTSNIQGIDLKAWYKKFVYGTILVFPVLFMGILCIHVYGFWKIVRVSETSILKSVPLRECDIQNLLDILIYLIVICLLIVLAGTIVYVEVVKKEETFYRVFIPFIGIILYSGLNIPSILKRISGSRFQNELIIILLLVIFIVIPLIYCSLISKQVVRWKPIIQYSCLYFFVTTIITIALCFINNAVLKTIGIIVFVIVCLILGICFSIKVNSIHFINDIVLIVLADWFTIMNYTVNTGKYIWVNSYILLTIGVVMLSTEWLVNRMSIIFKNDDFSKGVKEVLSNGGIIGTIVLLAASFFKLFL